VHCLAGWTAALSGHPLQWGAHEGRRGANFVLVDGKEVLIPHYAAEALGLSVSEASDLFFSTNTTLWLRLAAITGGEITLAKIEYIIAQQDAARHRSDDPSRDKDDPEKKTEDTERDTDRTEPDRTGRDDEESDGRDNEEPRIRELVHA
jgi:hypothetical protein